ncbi:radical SAM family heme chaperone HemW [Pseudomonas thermotolerans]|uniref:radical SAM family heme chaperone HemW n=1 Tax=Zestomonas thermotolerans TaxID=157784 RepID=UPI0009DA08DF
MSRRPSAPPPLPGGGGHAASASPAGRGVGERETAFQLPPLALYVHIPWCVRKCPYCDFNSHAAGAELPEEAYVDALLADLEADLAQVHGRELISIFFGGGTPSLFSARALGRLLEGVERRVPFAADIEITLEANPGTFEQAKFRDYRQLGINRLSIGIQSFQEAQLKALGRIHDGAEAIRAADMARAAGFDNFNLDLMHGLPGQSVEDALADLRTAIAQTPTHLSWYQLTLEPNTVFWNQPPALPEDDVLWDIQEAGQALLAEQGYAQYEISAYARAGRRARHNLNYWTFGDFLGIGAGAHAKLSAPDGRIRRTWKTRLPKDYLAPGKRFQAGERLLEADELPFEFLMNALRLTEGVPATLFPERTGLPLGQLAAARHEAERRGLLDSDPERLVATPRGQLFLNDLLQLFLA